MIPKVFEPLKFYCTILIFTGEKDSKKQDNKPQKREDQLSHLNIDLAPTSPQPSQSSDAPPLSRENSIQASLSASNLSPDAQKFLKFAGKLVLIIRQPFSDLIIILETYPNSANPVQMPHNAVSDQGLLCILTGFLCAKYS